MVTTVKQFKKNNPDLKGKKFILCEHLKNKTMDNVAVNLWLGDSMRLLLCPICEKVHRMTVWDNVVKGVLFATNAVHDLKQYEYGQWLETAGKENKDVHRPTDKTE